MLLLKKTIKSTIVLVLVCLLCRFGSARKTKILDQDGTSSSIESIARVVCDTTRGTDKQISQHSTIGRLIQFLNSISPDHRLASCAQQSLAALEQMQLILTTGSVCSEAKLDLIERFHRNFISKMRKYRKEQKANNLSAPRLLKLFYMHYVSAVSATCEEVANRQLETVTFNKEAENDDSDSIFNQVGGLFGKIESSRGYKDMFVLWNFIDFIPIEKDAKLSRFLHQGKIRLVLQMQKADSLTKIQEKCRKLKPVYSRSLIPVIRLADLGFYPESEQLVNKLSSNSDYSHLYTFTQICETFLGLQATPNDSLKPGQIVVLSKYQTAGLHLMNEEAEDHQLGSNEDSRFDSLLSVEKDESQKFIKKVESNVDSRISEQNKILRRLIRRFRGESKEHKGQFLLSDGSTKEDLESIAHDSLPSIDESDPLGPFKGDEEGDDENGVVRRKRGLIKYVKKALKVVVYYFLVLCHFTMYLVLKIVNLVIFIPIGIVLGYMERVMDKDVDKWLEMDEKAMNYKVPFFPAKVVKKLGD